MTYIFRCLITNLVEGADVYAQTMQIKSGFEPAMADEPEEKSFFCLGSSASKSIEVFAFTGLVFVGTPSLEEDIGRLVVEFSIFS